MGKPAAATNRTSSNMKTTLNIDATVMADMMSELVETALRLLLWSQRERGRMPVPARLEVAGKCINLVSMTRTAKSKLTKRPKPRRQVRGNRQPGHWVLQDAKARFSELVRRVRSEGPQHVTVHGRDEVVVISAEEFRRLKGDLTGQALISAMQASPHREIDIEPRGVRMPVRDVAL